MDEKNSSIIILLATSPIALLIFHACMTRLMRFIKLNISNQKLVIYCIIAMNLPLLLIVYMLSDSENIHILDFLYAFITYNLISYSYFHFFNMSETARRIKILTGIFNGEITNEDDIEKYYNYEKSLQIRLDRLKQLSQIEEIKPEQFILKGKLLYAVSYLIKLFRKLLAFESR